VTQPPEQKPWTVGDVLQWTAKRLSELDFPTPRLDAQLLLSSVTGLTRLQLYTHHDQPLTLEERQKFRQFVQRRQKGEPIAYLLNRIDWASLDLYVDSRVLIPRPETESMLELILSWHSSQKEQPLVIFDLCTGSGCLALALAREFPNAKVVGVDICEKALEVAQINRKRNHLDRVEFLLGDVTSPSLLEYLQKIWGKVDILVSNPPYVSASEWEKLEASVKDFEPKKALVSADLGLQIAKKMIEGLTSCGAFENVRSFLMELAEGQPQQLFGNHKLPAQPYSLEKKDWPIGAFFSCSDLENKQRFLGFRSPFNHEN
jgi:release factor glutamine methyltransferase